MLAIKTSNTLLINFRLNFNKMLRVILNKIVLTVSKNVEHKHYNYYAINHWEFMYKNAV